MIDPPTASYYLGLVIRWAFFFILMGVNIMTCWSIWKRGVIETLKLLK